MNGVIEDAGERTSNAAALNLRRRAANSAALAAVEQLEPRLLVDELKSSRFLGVESASVTFGKDGARVFALRDVSLAFERSTLSLVMGPSGSGKTTLLSLLGCLLSPDEGSVFVDGIAVNELSGDEKTVLRREQIGFIFQAFRLFHSLSAFENVMIAAEIGGTRDQPSSNGARQLLENLGLGDKLHLKPNALSGGEKQ